MGPKSIRSSAKFLTKSTSNKECDIPINTRNLTAQKVIIEMINQKACQIVFLFSEFSALVLYCKALICLFNL